MSVLNKLKSFNLLLLIPFIIFTFLLVHFVDLPPCWDASTEYAKTGIVTGGIHESLIQYMKNGSLHPPLKLFLSSIFYSIGGENFVSYHIMGIMLGYLAIVGMYLLCKNIFNKNVAIIASILLATFPLFVANATDNYTDYLVTVFLLIALYFYSKNKFFYYALAGSAVTLSKDTGLLLPASVFVIELLIFFFSNKTKKDRMPFLKRILFVSIPLFSYFLWYLFVRTSGFEVFKDYIFSETGDKGAIITILYNLLTLNFFHAYAKAHILEIAYLNFNWVYWLIMLFGFVSILKKTKFIKIQIAMDNKIKSIFFIMLFFICFGLAAITFQILFTLDRVFSINMNWIVWPTLIVIFTRLIGGIHIDTRKLFQRINEPKIRTILVMFLFFISYVLTVATFQIWDTPRYNLPLMPFLIIGASVVVINYSTKIRFFLMYLLIVLNFVGLFYSVDPISIFIWSRNTASGQTFYTLDKNVLGNDDLAYNLQYLLVMEKRKNVFQVNTSKICNFTN